MITFCHFFYARSSSSFPTFYCLSRLRNNFNVLHLLLRVLINFLFRNFRFNWEFLSLNDLWRMRSRLRWHNWGKFEVCIGIHLSRHLTLIINLWGNYLIRLEWTIRLNKNLDVLRILKQLLDWFCHIFLRNVQYVVICHISLLV